MGGGVRAKGYGVGRLALGSSGESSRDATAGPKSGRGRAREGPASAARGFDGGVLFCGELMAKRQNLKRQKECSPTS